MLDKHSDPTDQIENTEMSDYETLASMGLENIQEIHRFSLQEKEGVDIIKVQFDREASSVLPDSTSFSFLQDDPAQQQKKLDAISELTQLTVKPDKDNSALLAQLEQDLERIESVMKSKLTEMRQDVAAMFPEDKH